MIGAAAPNRLSCTFTCNNFSEAWKPARSYIPVKEKKNIPKLASIESWLIALKFKVSVLSRSLLHVGHYSTVIP